METNNRTLGWSLSRKPRSRMDLNSLRGVSIKGQRRLPGQKSPQLHSPTIHTSVVIWPLSSRLPDRSRVPPKGPKGFSEGQPTGGLVWVSLVKKGGLWRVWRMVVCSLNSWLVRKPLQVISLTTPPRFSFVSLTNRPTTRVHSQGLSAKETKRNRQSWVKRNVGLCVKSNFNMGPTWEGEAAIPRGWEESGLVRRYTERRSVPHL